MSKESRAERALVVYFSQTGATERVAEAIASGLNASGSTTEVVALGDVTEAMVRQATIVGIGTPVFYYKEPVVVRRFIEALPAATAERSAAFTFITHGGNPVNTLRRMQKQLGRRGYTVLNSFACHGYDSFPAYLKTFRQWGHPDIDELREATEFGHRLTNEARWVREDPNFAPPKYEFVGGGYFVRSVVCQGGMMKRLFPALLANEQLCIRCGVCAKNCPTGAITLSPTPKVDDKCMWCYLCERICPVQAFEPDWGPLRKKLGV